MSKHKPIDKSEARQRRNRMLDNAAASKLSLTEGVREMRAISGLTQDDFARHRGVSARVIKALELGQGNPTVATLNRIGEVFGLRVGFVPIRPPDTAMAEHAKADVIPADEVRNGFAELQKQQRELLEEFKRAFRAESSKKG